ncbi:TSA-domain-containing [Fusarium albosuccineum]|uniref:thioredoxin-dependent peroxiredoxin n=1 Tax=Fusarium albosuccineum TaxID=1237068 RepID=A0A8H4LI49_9HYPO|nr:TSA-domain-containing [Fusarium albosuccineum]
MTQTEELTAILEGFKSFPGSKPVNDAVDKFSAEFKPENAIQVGDKFPEFRLKDATGKEVSSADLLAKGPLLITFYRGEWCPYCNVALQHLQRHLDEFAAKGVTLVALTPELPDHSLTTSEKNGLKFPVLTDLHNEVAKKLNIIYNQSSARDLHKQFGVNIVEVNGDDSYDMPIPATLLVDSSGVVRNTYLEPDFRKRMEPKIALEWIDALQK